MYPLKLLCYLIRLYFHSDSFLSCFVFVCFWSSICFYLFIFIFLRNTDIYWKSHFVEQCGSISFRKAIFYGELFYHWIKPWWNITLHYLQIKRTRRSVKENFILLRIFILSENYVQVIIHINKWNFFYCL